MRSKDRHWSEEGATLRQNVISSIIPGRTSWAVSAPIESAGVVGSGPRLGVSNHHVRCLHPGGCNICMRKNVIRSTIPGRASRSCLLRSASRQVSMARVARSVSAIAMYDACIRADAESASARSSSRQPSQVVHVGRVCSDRPVGWCQRLGSPAPC
jgi:hypothetical protein